MGKQTGDRLEEGKADDMGKAAVFRSGGGGHPARMGKMAAGALSVCRTAQTVPYPTGRRRDHRDLANGEGGGSCTGLAARSQGAFDSIAAGGSLDCGAARGGRVPQRGAALCGGATTGDAFCVCGSGRGIAALGEGTGRGAVSAGRR